MFDIDLPLVILSKISTTRVGIVLSPKGMCYFNREICMCILIVNVSRDIN